MHLVSMRGHCFHPGRGTHWWVGSQPPQVPYWGGLLEHIWKGQSPPSPPIRGKEAVRGQAVVEQTWVGPDLGRGWKWSQAWCLFSELPRLGFGLWS